MTDSSPQEQPREQARTTATSPARTDAPHDGATAHDAATASVPALAPGKSGIAPVANPRNDSSLTFDWRPLDLGESRSFGCTIASRLGHALTVTIEQGLYKKTLHGTPQLQVAAIPLAEPGTAGKLVARDDETGAVAEFEWEWRGAGGSLARRSSPAFPQAPASPPLAPPDVAVAAPIAIDGEWQCQPYTGLPYALRISGNTGVATLSNAPNVFSPGDAILYIDGRSANGFSGRLLYTHGRFLRIEAVLTSPDTIQFAAPPGQGGDYERSGTWVRRRN